MTTPASAVPLSHRLTGEVKIYPYRSACVTGVIAEFPRKGLESVELMLANAVGRDHRGNHDVYELRQSRFGEERVSYYSFSDDLVQLGTGIKESRW